MDSRIWTRRSLVLWSLPWWTLPLAACPAEDDGGATASAESTGGEGSTTNTNTTASTSDPTTSSTTVSTTIDPDSSSGTVEPTTADPTTTTTTTGESTDSTTTGGALCEVMIPPPRECPFPAPSPRRLGTGAQGSPDIDDLEPYPDEAYGGGFIVEPDAGGPTQECDIWTQDCPDGEKCMPWANDGGGSWNATRCSPLDPNPGDVGDPCTVEGSGVSGIDDCGLGQMCWGVDPETNMGYCLELCSCDPDFPVCNTPNTLCTVTNGGVLPLCLAVCNPLDPDACPAGEGCYGVGDGFQCAPDVSGGEGAPGDPCAFINVCDPGNFCANPDSVPGCGGGEAGCCSPFCTLGDDGACLDGQSCLPWFEQGAAPDECLATIGACVL